MQDLPYFKYQVLGFWRKLAGVGGGGEGVGEGVVFRDGKYA